MAVKIRLRRMGARKKPFYRLVVADARSPRDGRFIEAVGTYDPLASPALVKLDADKIREWMVKGARPTEIARQLLVSEGVLEGTRRGEPAAEKAPKLSKKARARAAAATEAGPAPAPVAPAEAAEDGPAPAAAPAAEAPVTEDEPVQEAPTEPAQEAPTEPAQEGGEPKHDDPAAQAEGERAEPAEPGAGSADSAENAEHTAAPAVTPDASKAAETSK